MQNELLKKIDKAKEKLLNIRIFLSSYKQELKFISMKLKSLYKQQQRYKYKYKIIKIEEYSIIFNNIIYLEFEKQALIKLISRYNKYQKNILDHIKYYKKILSKYKNNVIYVDFKLKIKKDRKK